MITPDRAPAARRSLTVRFALSSDGSAVRTYVWRASGSVALVNLQSRASGPTDITLVNFLLLLQTLSRVC